jgi:hypothetical protein
MSGAEAISHDRIRYNIFSNRSKDSVFQAGSALLLTGRSVRND